MSYTKVKYNLWTENPYRLIHNQKYYFLHKIWRRYAFDWNWLGKIIQRL